MATVDYTAKAERAQRMLARYGGPVRLLRVEESEDYDPRGGASSPPTAFDGVGVRLDYEQSDVDGTRILQGDQQVYLGVVSMLPPRPGDTLALLDEAGNIASQHPVVGVSELAPAGVPVLYTLQIRGTTRGSS